MQSTHVVIVSEGRAQYCLNDADPRLAGQVDTTSAVVPATAGLVSSSCLVILGLACTLHSLWSQKSVMKHPRAMKRLFV